MNFKKHYIYLLLIWLLTLNSCSKNNENIQKNENKNINEITQIINKKEEEIINETDVVPTTTEPKSQNYISFQEAINIVKSYDNENLIFKSENRITKHNTDKWNINKKNIDTVKMFLEKINFSEVYELNGFPNEIRINQNICYKIYDKYSERSGDYEIDRRGCDMNLNENREYSNSDLKVEIYELENKYFLFRSYVDSREGENLITILENIQTGEINFIDAFKSATEIYFYKENLYFKHWTDLYALYDIVKKEFKNYSERKNNQSNKWWIEENNYEITVESMNDGQRINLGILPTEFQNKNCNWKCLDDSLNFFESNDSQTKFAMPIKFDDSNCNYALDIPCIGIATIIYGNLEKNGLQNISFYKINIRFFPDSGADISFSTNTGLFLYNNLLITKPATPNNFEFTIFDTEKKEFIYRHNEVGEKINFE